MIDDYQYTPPETVACVRVYQRQREYPNPYLFKLQALSPGTIAGAAFALPTYCPQIPTIFLDPHEDYLIALAYCDGSFSHFELKLRCVPDLDGDNMITEWDVSLYLMAYDNGLAAADLDNGSGTGTPDGGVGMEDLLYYLEQWERGCRIDVWSS